MCTCTCACACACACVRLRVLVHFSLIFLAPPPSCPFHSPPLSSFVMYASIQTPETISRVLDEKHIQSFTDDKPPLRYARAGAARERPCRQANRQEGREESLMSLKSSLL